MMKQELGEVHNHPYLGIELTSDLSWSLHIRNITNKANRSLNFIRWNLHDCPQHIKEIAYQSFVRPNIEYASSVWDPHLSKDHKALDKIQRKAARFVTSTYSRDESVKSILDTLGWQTLGERRFVDRQAVLWKAAHEKIAVPLPPYLLPQKSKTRNRHSCAFINISTKTDQYKFSFFPRSIRYWNLLPKNIVESTSFEHFKETLWKAIGNGTIVVMPPKSVEAGNNKDRTKTVVC